MSLKLIDLADHKCTDKCTDKNTGHSYLPVYEELFADKRKTATAVMEIGICKGASIKLWAEYFENANVFGFDTKSQSQIHYFDYLNSHTRVKLFLKNNAYDTQFWIKNFFYEDGSPKIKFDVMIDDGPHTLDSMIVFIRDFSTLLKDDGVLIVEDVQDIKWIEVLRENTPEHLRPYIQVRDLRAVKGRYDDILFIIDRRWQPCEKST